MDGVKTLRVPIEKLKSVGRSNPKIAFSVFMNCQYRVANKRGTIVLPMIICFKVGTVEYVKPIICTNPDIPVFILINIVDITIR